MATPNIVPRANGEGGLGTAAKGWGKAFVTNTTTSSATEGAKLVLAADDGAVMADNHRLGVIEFKGAEDTSNTLSIGARIEAICRDAWDGSNNDADLVFYTTNGTTETAALTLDADRKATFSSNVDINGSDNKIGPAAGDTNFSLTGNKSAHDAAGPSFSIFGASTTAGTTNNIAGGDLIIGAGQGKGSGAGGDIIFKTANAGGSGSSLNALATALTISDDLSAQFTGDIKGIKKEVIALNNSGGAVDRTLTAAESGSLITIDPSTDNTNTIKITLPTNATGLNYKFVVTADAANTAADVLFTSASDSNDFRGHFLATNAGVELVANACAFTLDVSVLATIGATSWEVVADGTFWAITGFYTGTQAQIGTSGDGLLLTNSTL